MTTGVSGIRILAVLALSVVVSTSAMGAPSIEGSIETGGNAYSSHNQYYNRTKTEYRVYENLAFDAVFNDAWSFHFNSRAAYQTQRSGSTGNWLLNFFYGYLDFSSENFDLKLGRIMDLNNLIYLYFDGVNLESKTKISDYRLTIDLYGGFIVRDDYVEEYRNPWLLYSPSSTDYRSIFISQRRGDYVGGIKAELMAKKVGIFGLEYQIVFNKAALAEHYVSVNVETMFSKIVKIYGYGTFDIVEKLPSNTLAAIQINPIDLLQIVVEHEYYRPVFLKDSYFWEYFKPFGNQEASARLIFFISKQITLDAKYGLLIYQSNGDFGNDASIGLEHRDIKQFALKLNARMILGPEGNLITAQLMLKRHVYMFDFLVGGGAEFYNEKSITKGLSPGYFATVGADARILRSLILSATGEYSSNRDYRYNVRGNLSLKYLF
jgi:hypothetical protein